MFMPFARVKQHAPECICDDPIYPNHRDMRCTLADVHEPGATGAVATAMAKGVELTITKLESAAFNSTDPKWDTRFGRNS